MSNKTDSRSFGISVKYKIPTKNKLAKEAPNMLNQEKKEDGGPVSYTHLDGYKRQYYSLKTHPNLVSSFHSLFPKIATQPNPYFP